MFAEFINTYGMDIIGGALLVTFGLIGMVVNKFLTDEVKRKIARAAMLFAEQVYKHLHGEEKMTEALNAASRMLAQYGIKFSPEEMRELIEAALGEFNAQAMKLKVQGGITAPGLGGNEN